MNLGKNNNNLGKKQHYRACIREQFHIYLKTKEALYALLSTARGCLAYRERLWCLPRQAVVIPRDRLSCYPKTGFRDRQNCSIYDVYRWYAVISPATISILTASDWRSFHNITAYAENGLTSPFVARNAHPQKSKLRETLAPTSP